MGHQAQVRLTNRKIRRAFGPEAADEFAIVDQRSKHAAAILRRGFWGRIKWLLFGR
jgi:hypothetical protein